MPANYLESEHCFCGEGACSRWAAKRPQNQSQLGVSGKTRLRGLRLLRSRAGASSLATKNLNARTCSALQRSAAMASTDSRISAGPL